MSDNPTLFERQVTEYGHDAEIVFGTQITLRDLFAGLATHALMNADIVQPGEGKAAALLAMTAYEVADALLAERGKP